jgi:hypothetical protein
MGSAFPAEPVGWIPEEERGQMVTFSFQDPDWVCHRQQESCPIEQPHLAANCRYLNSDMIALPTKTIDLCDKDGFPKFRATIEELGSHWVEFSVREILGYEDGDKAKPMFEIVGSDPVGVYLRATIKWDGCSHVYFGEMGYLHICGANAWKNHCQLMEWLYKSACELLPQLADESPWKMEGSDNNHEKRNS